MDPQWLGPYEVTKDLGKGFYTFSDPNTGIVFVKRVNGSHLKTYLTSSSQRVDDSVAESSPQVRMRLHNNNIKKLISIYYNT